MSPLPGTRVIHPAWSAHHQPTAEGGMTGVCSLFDPHQGPAPFPLPEDWEGLDLLKADVPCRVQVLNNSKNATAAEQPVGTRQYLVGLPIENLPPITAGERGTVIKVTAAKDAGLIGRTLRVMDIQHGTEMFERDLICVDNLTQNNP